MSRKLSRCEHLLPEVAGAVAGGMLRIAGAALHLAGMAAAVERQKVRRPPLQPGRHVHLVRIGGEMHQRAFLEVEQRRARIAVLHVLPHRVAPALAGAGILQLAGGDRHTVHCEHQIHRVRGPRMAGHLPRHGQPVLPVEAGNLLVEPVGGLEVGEPEGLAVELEAVPQDVQRALDVEFLDQSRDQERLEPGAVQRPHFVPQLRLRVLDEGEDASGEEGTLDVPLGEVTGFPAPLRQHLHLDRTLEGLLGGLGHGDGPRMNRACSARSIAWGAMHLTPRPMHGSGIFTFRNEPDGTSFVTTECE